MAYDELEKQYPMTISYSEKEKDEIIDRIELTKINHMKNLKFMESQKYPEHEKLSNVRELSQQLGGFIEWLGTDKKWKFGRYLAEEESDYGEFVPVIGININSLLAEFYGIDLVKLEEEKCQMLSEIREVNKK